jgi:hypothetical protein
MLCQHSEHILVAEQLFEQHGRAAARNTASTDTAASLTLAAAKLALLLLQNQPGALTL